MRSSNGPRLLPEGDLVKCYPFIEAAQHETNGRVTGQLINLVVKVSFVKWFGPTGRRGFRPRRVVC